MISEDDSEEIAFNLNFNGFEQYSGLSGEISTVEGICEKEAGTTVFLYAEGIQTHSAASIDIRCSNRSKYADLLIFPGYLLNLGNLKLISSDFNKIVSENAIFAFSVKALLIALSIIGIAKLWFVVLIDLVAEIATVLNSIRIISTRAK